MYQSPISSPNAPWILGKIKGYRHLRRTWIPMKSSQSRWKSWEDRAGLEWEASGCKTCCWNSPLWNFTGIVKGRFSNDCRKTRKIGGNPWGSAQKPLHCCMGSQLWICHLGVAGQSLQIMIAGHVAGSICSQNSSKFSPSVLRLRFELFFWIRIRCWSWRHRWFFLLLASFGNGGRTAEQHCILVPSCAMCHPGTAEDLRRHPWAVSWPFASFCLFVMHLDRELQGWWHCVGIECFGWPQSSKVFWCIKAFDLAHSADCWFLWC